MVCFQLASEHNPEKIRFFLAESDRLKKEFDERHAYWNTTLKGSDIKTLLLEESYKPAVEFYRMRDEEFIPAIKVGNSARVSAVMQKK